MTSNQYFPATGSEEAITVPLMPSAESVRGISVHFILALSTRILRVAEVTGPGAHFQEKVYGSVWLDWMVTGFERLEHTSAGPLALHC